MLQQFTAAAQRAIVFASKWSSRTDYDELEAAALLLGLLSEPECRAAIFLAKQRVDTAAVRGRWPGLFEKSTPPRWGGDSRFFAEDVRRSLQLAQQLLAFLPQPLELATEHLLLGLAAADHDVSVWLRERGVDPYALQADIRKLHGYLVEEPDASGESSLAWESPRDISVPSVDDLSQGDAPGQIPIPSESSPTTISASQQIAALRVLDAAADRAREGLRVIEDFLRFALDDRHLTDLCKQLRHDLSNAFRQLSPEELLAARETQADVGTTLTTSSEQTREGVDDVLTANFARLQESLRTLEEFGKLVDAKLAADVKQIRYRTYTLHRAACLTAHSVDRLNNARLYVLIDGMKSVDEFQRLVDSLIRAGVDVIQLRDKHLGDRELVERARILRAITQRAGQVNKLPHGRPLFVMNDRPDLAVLAQADGVHVGQDELTVKDARSIVGPKMLIGVSTHSIQQARQAVLDGANYIGVGPVFPSDTKAFKQFPGVELLRQVAAEIRMPAFAIGGIHRDNLDMVLAAGFTRIAVSGAVTAAEEPERAAGELLERMSNDQVPMPNDQ